MAGLKRRLEGEIEIRAAGGDAFHEILVNRPHHLTNVNPGLVQGCDLHEGTFGKQGSKICWRYTIGNAYKHNSASVYFALCYILNPVINFYNFLYACFMIIAQVYIYVLFSG